MVRGLKLVWGQNYSAGQLHTVGLREAGLHGASERIQTLLEPHLYVLVPVNGLPHPFPLEVQFGVVKPH